MKETKLIATILSILAVYAAFLFCLLLDSRLLFKDLLVTDEKRHTIMKPRKQLIDAAVANGSFREWAKVPNDWKPKEID